MAKPKKSTGRCANGRKNHGPKRKLFHEHNKAMRYALEHAGLFNKFSDRVSWTFACQARGIKVPTDAMWAEYCKLKTNKEKSLWLKALNK